MKTKFAPVKFQAALAAGGVALMAFNYLQFAVPHGSGLIKLADITWSDFDVIHSAMYVFLIAIMLLFSLANFAITVFFLKGFLQWLRNKNQLKSFMENPLTNITVFVPIASFSMTTNVIWAPFAFFFKDLSTQAMMWPSLFLFGLLWMALFYLEFQVAKNWFTKTIELSKLNFVWLLDVFTFGLVSLTGTGIASMAKNTSIASIASFASLFVVGIGMLLFIAKFSFLAYQQLKSSRLPEKPILPAFFLVIPITCLLGLSFYRIASFLHIAFAFDVRALSFFILTVAYIITIGWGVFAVFLLLDYFRKDFFKIAFSPTQWSMICALVGSQVLGVYVNGLHYPGALLSVVNYASTVLAAFLYVLIFSKFHKANMEESRSEIKKMNNH
ncbi:selenoprotein TsoY [uncultured Trichococcus sp.]|uniref:selenoprotein TsoY n=1 Tax=uncultured Trichococcus sp. TaxID=189665 RepID=UPI002A187103|nr:hypothetical protein [uncultured Trichococcus sp.]